MTNEADLNRTKELAAMLLQRAQAHAPEGVKARVYGAVTDGEKSTSYRGAIVHIEDGIAIQKLNDKGSFAVHEAEGLAVGDVVNIGYYKDVRSVAPHVPGEKVERPARAARAPKDPTLESSAPKTSDGKKKAVKLSMAEINDDITRRFVEPVIKSMEEGNSIFHKTWVTNAEDCMPHNPTTGNRYQGANAVILLTYLMAKGSQDTRFMTFRQGQAMAAAMAKQGTPEDKLPTLREGAKGIFLTKFGQGPTRKKDVLDEDGKPVLDDDGKAKVKELRGRTYLQGFHVFHASDFDNMPALKLAEPRAEWEVHAEAKELMDKCGVEIREVYGDRAFYSPSQDIITVPTRQQYDNQNDCLAVILHEIGHSTGHASRLARDGIVKFDHFGSPQYAAEEMTAELTSVIVMGQLGLQSDANIKNHAGYLTGWLSRIKDDPKCFITACNEATKASEWVFGRHPIQLEAQAQLAKERGMDLGLQQGLANASGHDFAEDFTDAFAPTATPQHQSAGMSM